MSIGTCDWGACEDLATGWRYEPVLRIMLPVCDAHRPVYVLAA